MTNQHNDDIQEAYVKGFREGYRKGDLERNALAIANSDLRSEVLALKQQLELLKNK